MRTPGTAAYHPERGRPVLEKLPSATTWAVELLQTELRGLEELKEEAREQMLGEARRHRIYRILKTAPGLGEVRVAQVMRVIVTPHRFRTKRQLWKYSGFGVVTVGSSDWVQREGHWVRSEVEQTRGLNRDCNALLKDIFKGAATTVLQQSAPSPLRVYYERLLANGTKPNLAKLTIARKIAAIVLAMWKKKEVYRPELVGWVKGSFFKVRRFQDRGDLLAQLAAWLVESNEERPSRATGEIPSVLLLTPAELEVALDRAAEGIFE